MAHAPGTPPLDELDAAQTLAAAEQALRARRAGEVAEMHLAAHWAALHGEPTGRRDPMTTPAARAPRHCASTPSRSWPWSASPTPPPPAP